ncbi:hypothetical protein FA10DRAFT_268915 [Acaromyces ingoldii]|uniref:Uncharacterized protein n=1 Tax=Acaromyces ingoldii TaxID=215250 RepID=A0A316YHX4_9BASI|nr:hypothetical protein FA10DRAFT_268915 [Acaromyces ingoldii]PWN88771.1 hypothetical protein FA10DRAFT_268915 [Acaromyces ingoldii]
MADLALPPPPMRTHSHGSDRSVAFSEGSIDCSLTPDEQLRSELRSSRPRHDAGEPSNAGRPGNHSSGTVTPQAHPGRHSPPRGQAGQEAELLTGGAARPLRVNTEAAPNPPWLGDNAGTPFPLVYAPESLEAYFSTQCRMQPRLPGQEWQRPLSWPDAGEEIFAGAESMRPQGGCSHCQARRRCEMGAYSYGVLAILASSEMANVLRGAVQDVDCAEFLRAFNRGHWHQELQNLEKTWVNGATMSLLYLFALGRAYRVDRPSFSPRMRLRMCILPWMHKTLQQPRLDALRIVIQRYLDWDGLCEAASYLAANLIEIGRDNEPRELIASRFGRVMWRLTQPDQGGSKMIWDRIDRFLANPQRGATMEMVLADWGRYRVWPEHRAPDSPQTALRQAHTEAFSTFSIHDEPFLLLEWMRYAAQASHERPWPFILAPARSDANDAERPANDVESLYFLELFANIFSVGRVLIVGVPPRYMVPGPSMTPQAEEALIDDDFAYNVKLACRVAQKRLGSPFVILLAQGREDNVPGANEYFRA